MRRLSILVGACFVLFGPTCSKSLAADSTFLRLASVGSLKVSHFDATRAYSFRVDGQPSRDSSFTGISDFGIDISWDPGSPMFRISQKDSLVTVQYFELGQGGTYTISTIIDTEHALLSSIVYQYDSRWENSNGLITETDRMVFDTVPYELDSLRRISVVLQGLSFWSHFKTCDALHFESILVHEGSQNINTITVIEYRSSFDSAGSPSLAFTLGKRDQSSVQTPLLLQGKNQQNVVYPNPSSGKVTVVIHPYENEREAVVRVWNLLGQLRMTHVQRLSTNRECLIELDISNLPSACYEVRVNDRVALVVKK